jgi:hypothetical protein
LQVRRQDALDHEVHQCRGAIQGKPGSDRALRPDQDGAAGQAASPLSSATRPELRCRVALRWVSANQAAQQKLNAGPAEFGNAGFVMCLGFPYSEKYAEEYGEPICLSIGNS